MKIGIIKQNSFGGTLNYIRDSDGGHENGWGCGNGNGTGDVFGNGCGDGVKRGNGDGTPWDNGFGGGNGCGHGTIGNINEV